MAQTYSVIGLMSGSSLDGIDLIHVMFHHEKEQWKFETEAAECVPYSEEMLSKLRKATNLNGKDLWQLHTELGHYFGKSVAQFVSKNNLDKIDFVASHGHTVFHHPELQFSTQIGDGAALAASSGLKVICDFRSSDVANGGQGAPVVPIGEKFLFPDYKAFLNIGGIANISFHSENKIIAYDCCVANQVLNYLANKKGFEFDKDGNLAAVGKANTALLEKLCSLPFCNLSFPKSLDNSYAKDTVIPLVEDYDLSVEDKLATYSEFVAVQISNAVNSFSKNEEKILITGGGAFNKNLIERLTSKTKTMLVVPDEKSVKFKESLIIAFMGVLRERKEVNVLSSITGAKSDTINGAIYEVL